MTFNYRLYQPTDLPMVARLWQGSTEWGTLTPEMVNWHLENSPFGKPIITLAENSESGEIVGQAVLMPSLVSIRGRTVTAFRPMAPILDRSVRMPTFNPLQHPIVKLFGFAFQELRHRGEQLVFMIPDPRWMVLLRMLPGFLNASFPLWSLPLPLASEFSLPKGYSCGPLQQWDERVDRLYRIASQKFACTVVRDAASLHKKAGPPDYQVLAVERAGELVGVVASRGKGDRQWLICDLLAADDEAERITLQSVVNFANGRSRLADPSEPICKVAILALPHLQPMLGKLGFKRDKYDFHLVVRIIDDSLSADDVDPSSWYLSAND